MPQTGPPKIIGGGRLNGEGALPIHIPSHHGSRGPAPIGEHQLCKSTSHGSPSRPDATPQRDPTPGARGTLWGAPRRSVLPCSPQGPCGVGRGMEGGEHPDRGAAEEWGWEESRASRGSRPGDGRLPSASSSPPATASPVLATGVGVAEVVRAAGAAVAAVALVRADRGALCQLLRERRAPSGAARTPPPHTTCPPPSTYLSERPDQPLPLPGAVLLRAEGCPRGPRATAPVPPGPRPTPALP